MLIRRRRARGVADRPGKCQDVSVEGSQEEAAQWALVRMQFNRRNLIRAYSTEVMSEVIQYTGVGCEEKNLDAT